MSSYYLTILSDCRLPFCLFTNRTKKARAEFAHAYSGTPLVRPPLLHPKSGLIRGVATCHG